MKQKGNKPNEQSPDCIYANMISSETFESVPRGLIEFMKANFYRRYANIQETILLAVPIL